MSTYVESLKRCFEKGEISSVKIQAMSCLTNEEKEYILNGSVSSEELQKGVNITS